MCMSGGDGVASISRPYFKDDSVRDTLRIDKDTTAALTPEALAIILCAGGDIVKKGVQDYILRKAKKETGHLRSVITYDTFESGFGRAALVMGWDTSVEDPKRKIEIEVAMKNSKHDRKHKHVISSSYVDVRGKTHYMRTVADYGRILEYSQRRRLRHMSEGFDDVEDKATSVMASMAENMLEKAADAAFGEKYWL